MIRLSDIRITTRLVIAIAIPLLFFAILAGYDLFNTWRVRAEMVELGEITQGATKISLLVHHLQRERGASAIFLQQQRRATARRVASGAQAFGRTATNRSGVPYVGGSECKLRCLQECHRGVARGSRSARRQAQINRRLQSRPARVVRLLHRHDLETARCCRRIGKNQQPGRNLDRNSRLRQSVARQGICRARARRRRRRTVAGQIRSIPLRARPQIPGGAGHLFQNVCRRGNAMRRDAF